MVSLYFRKQQLVYGVALLFSALACAASGLVNRFDDIDFTGNLSSQYSQFKSSATPLLETNVAFAIFLSILLLSNLFKQKATSVWFELIWTFVFGTMEVIDIVILANSYPSSQCSYTPSGTNVTKRDDPASDTVIGQVASSSASTRVKWASEELCENWAVIMVFLTLIVITLFAQWFRIALIGLRHRRSNPDFFWCDETPSPFTWNLGAPTPSGDDAASVASSDLSILNEKKLVTSPAHLQVRVQLPAPAEVDPRVC